MTTLTQTGLIRVCAWCHRMVDDDNKSFGSRLLAWFHEMTEGDKITHGICNSCHQVQKIKLAQYRREKNANR